MSRRPASLDESKNGSAAPDQKENYDTTLSASKNAQIEGQNDSTGSDDDEQAKPEPPDENQPTESDLDAVDEAEAAAILVSLDKLRAIVADFPEGTSNEQVVFGRANHRFTLQDLKNLVLFADATD